MPFAPPTGIYRTRSSSSDSRDKADSESGSISNFSPERMRHTGADIAICLSGAEAVMDAGALLAPETGPLGLAIAFTGALGLAACPMLLGSDIFASEKNNNELHDIAGIFTPGGMALGVGASLMFGPEHMKDGATYGALLSDGATLGGNFSVGKTLGELKFDIVGVANDAYEAGLLFFGISKKGETADAPSNEDSADDPDNSDESDKDEGPEKTTPPGMGDVGGGDNSGDDETGDVGGNDDGGDMDGGGGEEEIRVSL